MKPEFKRKPRPEPIILKNIMITDAGSEGKAIAKHEGMVIFIPFGAPGDVVDVQLLYKKPRFAEGRIIKIHSESPFRQKPFCEHFGLCGGCRWQHITYRQQLSVKQKHVRDNLERIAGIENPDILAIIGSDKVDFYRNKLEYTFGDRRWLSVEEISTDQDFDQRSLGFHIPERFDKLVQIEKCHLQPDPSNAIRNRTYKFAIDNNLKFYNLYNKTGFVRNLVIRNNMKGEVMLIFVVSENREDVLEQYTKLMTAEFPEIVSMYAGINEKVNDSLEGVPLVHLHGDEYLTEEMDGLQFRIAPTSFFQTNTSQALKMYQVALKLADLQGKELVYDLYTGTGTIAAFLSRKAAKVIGIEYVEAAIEDGKKNLELNEIENVELYHGDMAKLFNFDWVRKRGFPDVIVTDPPRAGMHPSVVNTIMEVKPAKIVYISCNPASQARDIAELKKDYDIIKVQPIDMFPQTHHVENIVLLHRKKNITN